MGNKHVSRVIHSQTIVGIAALAVLTIGVGTAQASFLNSCTTYCHGIPPRDGNRKANPHFDSQSSSFTGNHLKHLPAAPVADDCSTCHTPVAPGTFGHENEIISMANSIKGYSSAIIRAKYDKGVFVNQTSIPNLINATCSNANCHFETKTLPWGSPAYTVPASCNACHGFPPAGSAASPSGGLAGSHARHDVYFSGTSGCQKCHPGYSGFTHATSAGRPLRVQGYLRDPLNSLEAGGTYSGTGVNYLPSKSTAQLFGSCSNLYCHSTSGPNATPIGYSTPAWNSGALTCASCHADMSTIASTAPNGNHYVHASTTYTAGAKFSCSVCHGTGYTASAITPATHVNRQVELSFSGGGTGTTYSKAAPVTPGTAWGSCSASLCHGSGSPVWGGSLWSTTDQCGKCHSSSAAGAVTQAVPFYSTSFPIKVTLNTDAKAGAHTNHLSSLAIGLSSNIACTDCHGTVTLTSATHMNGSTTFVWSVLATKAGALAPIYTATTGQCTATYCHGNSMPGGDTTGSNRSPVWKDPNYLPATISAAACGTCHGFPPSSASGHPSGITIPVGFPGSATIGTTCSCHANINTAGNSYANIFVNPALHINGILETPTGGHSVPYPGSTHNSAAGASPFTACTGCHTNTKNAAFPYPQAVGVPPDCQNCHTKSSPVGNVTSGCYSCHGASGATGNNIGRPVTANTTSFPDRQGQHGRGEHNVTCSTCHAWGTGSVKHGWSNRKKSFSAYSAVKQKVTIWNVPNPAAGTRSTGTGTCSGTPSTGCGTHGSSCFWY